MKKYRKGRLELAEEKHSVVLIHGIRTQAEWQQRAERVLHSCDRNVRPVPTRYEFFDIIRFLIPLEIVRRKPIERIAKIIRFELGRSDKVSVIAHSFGTYIISKILEQHSDICFNKIILCGSIVKDDFPWEKYTSRIADGDTSNWQVINDCGMKDKLPVLAKSITWGYGSSGRFGFGHSIVKDRFHQAGHSDFFTNEYIEKYWVSYLTDDHVEKGILPDGVTSWWLSLLTIVHVKYIICTIVFVFFTFGKGNIFSKESTWLNQSVNDYFE